MTFAEAVIIAEHVEGASYERQVEAWQLLHDTGIAYTLQGWFGRTCILLLAEGIINA